MQFDDIIVGGGSSGAVLAARLSEDSRRKVLLIEAGPDYPDIESTPPSLLNGCREPDDHDWGFTAGLVAGAGEDQPPAGYPRGKVIGGSSSVNACLALRGAPADYDEWQDFGGADWSFGKVLPYLIRLETDREAHGEYHGAGGPLPLRRYGPRDLWSAQAAFVEACVALGFPQAEDNNHPDATGVGSGPWNQGDGFRRISTAIAYLASARSRPNLAIRGGCLADRVLFEGARAVGVEIETEAGREVLRAGRITLCAGAIGSPAILLRSGVGLADELRALGIEPRLPLRGVGANLIDHPTLGVAWEAPPDIVDENAPLLQTLLRYTASGSVHENDMQLLPFQGLPQPALRLYAALMKPKSTGTLRLASSDPNVQPDIRLNLVSDGEDARRLADGLKLIARFIRTPGLLALGTHTVTLPDGESLSAEQYAERVSEDNWAQDLARGHAEHYFHAVGTARMGSGEDPGAVVDGRGRVHGLAGLRVADASIMPTIPRANTNLTCIMIAERIADWICEEDG